MRQAGLGIDQQPATLDRVLYGAAGGADRGLMLALDLLNERRMKAGLIAALWGTGARLRRSGASVSC